MNLNFLPRACAGEGDREAVEGELPASEGPLRPFGAPPPAEPGEESLGAGRKTFSEVKQGRYAGPT
jgi:hypothetical protein